jgi:C4-dicarboxylate transporter DctQ subunit
MNRILDRLEEFIIATLMATATLVTFVAVVHRYASGFAIPYLQDWLLALNFSWAQELCIILFVWMAKFGAAYGVRTGIHVGVDIVVNHLEGWPRMTLVYLGLACGVLFTGLIGCFGAVLVWDNGMAYDMLRWFGMDVGDRFEGPTTPDLEWSTWMVYLAIPLGSFLMCLRFVQVMASFARSGELPRHDHGHVEGLDVEQNPDVLLEGEAISVAEDIEHHPQPTEQESKPQ